MQNLHSGDKILISGSCGEDWIIAEDWTKDFAKAEIRSGDHVTHVDNTQPRLCHACGQKVERKVKDGEIFITLRKYNDDDLVELNHDYDLIFKVEHNKGGFGPTLVGGKRYMSSQ